MSLGPGSNGYLTTTTTGLAGSAIGGYVGALLACATAVGGMSDTGATLVRVYGLGMADIVVGAWLGLLLRRHEKAVRTAVLALPMMLLVMFALAGVTHLSDSPPLVGCFSLLILPALALILARRTALLGS